MILFFLGSSGCESNETPITLSPQTHEVAQLVFATHPVARYNASDQEVWVGAPPHTAAPSSIVRIAPSGLRETSVRATPEGSFLYKFKGDPQIEVSLRWISPEGTWHEETLGVTNPQDNLFINVGAAGKYPNRLTVRDSLAWVVNSGDDEITSYNLETLVAGGERIRLPQWSNPWEVAFFSANEGIVTTLFGGVFIFDTAKENVEEIETGEFRPFASPNGCTALGTKAWVTNPNPISYFPTEMGEGWLSEIDLNSKRVISELKTQWLNPQYVITDGKLIYVSCSGTIDFLPPDYIAHALTSGGVHVIDPERKQILESYEIGLGGPGPMALSPDNHFLYIGSAVGGCLFRIDLKEKKVLNDAENPIIISETPGTFIPFVEVDSQGLLICGSFNDDTLHFVDSWTGEKNPFPFFEGVKLSNGSSDFWGIQDGSFCLRNGKKGILILSTVKSGLHWLEL